MESRKKLGEILLEAGIIDKFQLKAALAEQAKWGGRLGNHLVQMGILTEELLVKGLSTQLKIPNLDLSAIDHIPKHVLKLVPQELAEKFHLMPVAVKTIKNKKTLIVAMGDPTNLDAIDELRFRTGYIIKAAVAGDTAIEMAIRKHYYGEHVEATPTEPIDFDGSSPMPAADAQRLNVEAASAGLDASTLSEDDLKGDVLQTVEPQPLPDPFAPNAMEQDWGEEVSLTDLGAEQVDPVEPFAADTDQDLVPEPAAFPPPRQEPAAEPPAPVPEPIAPAPVAEPPAPEPPAPEPMPEPAVPQPTEVAPPAAEPFAPTAEPFAPAQDTAPPRAPTPAELPSGAFVPDGAFTPDLPSDALTDAPDPLGGGFIPSVPDAREDEPVGTRDETPIVDTMSSIPEPLGFENQPTAELQPTPSSGPEPLVASMESDDQTPMAPEPLIPPDAPPEREEASVVDVIPPPFVESEEAAQAPEVPQPPEDAPVSDPDVGSPFGETPSAEPFAEPFAPPPQPEEVGEEPTVELSEIEAPAVPVTHDGPTDPHAAPPADPLADPFAEPVRATEPVPEPPLPEPVAADLPIAAEGAAANEPFAEPFAAPASPEPMFGEGVSAEPVGQPEPFAEPVAPPMEVQASAEEVSTTDAAWDSADVDEPSMETEGGNGHMSHADYVGQVWDYNEPAVEAAADPAPVRDEPSSTPLDTDVTAPEFEAPPIPDPVMADPVMAAPTPIVEDPLEPPVIAPVIAEVADVAPSAETPLVEPLGLHADEESTVPGEPTTSSADDFDETTVPGEVTNVSPDSVEAPIFEPPEPPTQDMPVEPEPELEPEFEPIADPVPEPEPDSLPESQPEPQPEPEPEPPNDPLAMIPTDTKEGRALRALASLMMEKGLLSPDELEAWLEAQQ